MFSCCRANPKKSKKSHDNTNDEVAPNATEDATVAAVTIVNEEINKTPQTIPTITIENGKLNDETNTDATNIIVTNENSEIVQNGNGNGNGCANGNVPATTNGSSKEPAELESLAETETATDSATVIEVAAVAEQQEVKQQEEVVAETVAPETVTQQQLDDNSSDHQTVDFKENALGCDQQNLDDNEPPQSLPNAINNDAQAAHTNSNSNASTENSTSNGPPSMTQDNAAATATSSTTTSATATSAGQPRSCLSRHNSTHTSIKKRVNISTHAEIIEPEPLPPAYLAKSASIGDDEDDVFSDSLPPPKRDSMCAPYIERDDESNDIVTDSMAAYAHGLPEWFNNERINDM